MTILIETIPHERQRYETVGDWKITPDGDIRIFVSETGDYFYNAMIAVHELWEVLLCRKRGITQKAVDAFDISFESKRENGNVDEPGDDPDAPYRDEHCSATGVERLLCAELGTSWKLYGERLLTL